MSISEIKSLKPTKSDFEHYFQEYYGPVLEKNGLVKVRGTHWVRLIDNQVLLGVHFVPEKSWFNLYYSLQPLFFPVEFPVKTMGYHDRRMTFFNAELIFCRAFHTSSYNNATPLFEGTKLKTVQYIQAVINNVILPAFQKIQDVQSCHQVYCEHRRIDPLFVDLDSRYLLQCVYLNLENECAEFRDKYLVPLLQSEGPDYCVFLAYEWLRRRGGAQYGIPVGALIDSLSGDRKLLFDWMLMTEAKSRKALSAITTDQGTVQNH